MFVCFGSRDSVLPVFLRMGSKMPIIAEARLTYSLARVGTLGEWKDQKW